MELSMNDLRELLGVDRPATPVCNDIAAILPRNEDRGLCIVAADRGHVFVGRLRVTEHEYVLTNAATVRRWGTTKGLGQLAAEGPQPNTVLDEEFSTVAIPTRAVIVVRNCKEDAWKR